MAPDEVQAARDAEQADDVHAAKVHERYNPPPTTDTDDEPTDPDPTELWVDNGGEGGS